ncbi:MAG: diguanylate cyclase [Chloroflexota bacterium]
MELRIYIQMLQRSWWIVLLTALSALAVALALTFVATPIYQATARFVVSPTLSLADERDVVRSLEVLDKRSIVVTYAEVLDSYRIYNVTLAALNLTPEQLEDYIYSTVVLPEANILELSVEGPDPQMAMLLANNIGQQAIDYIRQLYSAYEIDFLDPATMPTVPIRPNPIRDASLAFVLGMVVGAVLAIIREQLRIPLETFIRRTMIDSTSLAFNRNYIERKLEEHVGRSSSAAVTMGLIQLDGLQGYLDVMPQPVIQRILREVTEVMREELRGNDLVGRWDNTIFAVLLFDTPGKAAVSTLGRVQAALSKPVRFSPDGEALNVRPKVGLVERQPGDPSGLIIDRAGEALDQAIGDETGLVLFKIRPLVGFG